MASANPSASATPRTGGGGTPVAQVHSPFGMRPRATSRAGAASPRAREDRPEVPVPEAKRPLDAASIQVSNQGARGMSLEDLSAALFALNGRMERSEGHGANLFEAVDFNALLLNEMCKELISLKQAQAATKQQVGQTVLKLTSDTREAVEELHARDAARDATLRDELNGMAAQLEKGHGLLAAQGDSLKLELDASVAQLNQVAGGGVQEPSAPPGLINQQLEHLQATVGGLAG